MGLTTLLEEDGAGMEDKEDSLTEDERSMMNTACIHLRIDKR